MTLGRFSVCVALSAAFFMLPICRGTPDNLLIMKEVALDEITPQAILNLPAQYSNRSDTYLCHYWVTFLRNIPEDHKSDHKDYGISFKAINWDLISGDSLTISAHRITDEPYEGGSLTGTTWKSTSASETLEYAEVYHDFCLNFTGDWKRSTAKLLITLYFNNTEQGDGFCPNGMSTCKCGANNDLSRRCISEDLLCNGQVNCGSDCDYDETSEANCRVKENTTVFREYCIWSDFEYMLMMTMTGLLLILIPAVFFLTMLYHRRLSQQRATPFAGIQHRQYPHVITISPDTPPRYDDLPEEVKVPYHGTALQNTNQ